MQGKSVHEVITQEMHTEARWGSLREEDHLEHLVVGGRILLKLFLGSGMEGTE